ncbi:MAG: hypothetical protein A4E66_02383 [Syntrophus sp. PtaB.Bin001]|nr:MAG: hypothetical protein A4E66_02383 [Syntrophus sp. PtaB.Bin001]
MAAQQGTLIPAQSAYFHALEKVASRSGRIQAAKDVHAGGFARSAGPHDRDELARIDAKVNAPQCLHRRLPFPENFCNPLENYQGFFR